MADINAIVNKAKERGIDMSWLAKRNTPLATPPMPRVSPVGAGVASLSPGAGRMLSAVGQYQANTPVYMPFAAGTPTLAAKNAEEAKRQAAAAEQMAAEQFAYQKEQDKIANSLRWAEHNRLMAGSSGGGVPAPEPLKISDAEKIVNFAKTLVPETEGKYEELPFDRQLYYRQKAEALLTGQPFTEQAPAMPTGEQSGGGGGNWFTNLFGGGGGGGTPAMPDNSLRPTAPAAQPPAMPTAPAQSAPAQTSRPAAGRYSDAEIRATLREAEAMGMTKQEIAARLREMGLDPIQYGYRTNL